MASLETENENLDKKLAQEQLNTNRLKEQIADVMAKLKNVEDEKREMDADLRRLRKQVDDLERELTETREASRMTMRKSMETTKQKKDTQKQQLQLFEENELLQNEVRPYDPIRDDACFICYDEHIIRIKDSQHNWRLLLKRRR